MTFHVSAVPAAADFVGLISAGVEDPMVIVTVAPGFIAAVAILQVIFGAEIVHVLQVVEPELIERFPDARLLKGKVVAEGDAALLPEPGKVITIFPLLGIKVAV